MTFFIHFVENKYHYMNLTLVQIMACCLFGTKSLNVQMQTFCQPCPQENISMNFSSTQKNSFKKKHLKCLLPNMSHFIWALKFSAVAKIMLCHYTLYISELFLEGLKDLVREISLTWLLNSWNKLNWGLHFVIVESIINSLAPADENEILGNQFQN